MQTLVSIADVLRLPDDGRPSATGGHDDRQRRRTARF
jgi:hypothetical protein